MRKIGPLQRDLEGTLNEQIRPGPPRIKNSQRYRKKAWPTTALTEWLGPWERERHKTKSQFTSKYTPVIGKVNICY